MEFLIERASIWKGIERASIWQGRPCKEAYQKPPYKEDRWYIEIESLDRLIDFTIKYDRVVITAKHILPNHGIIIYDDYIE